VTSAVFTLTLYSATHAHSYTYMHRVRHAVHLVKKQYGLRATHFKTPHSKRFLHRPDCSEPSAHCVGEAATNISSEAPEEHIRRRDVTLRRRKINSLGFRIHRWIHLRRDYILALFGFISDTTNHVRTELITMTRDTTHGRFILLAGRSLVVVENCTNDACPRVHWHISRVSRGG